MLPTLRPASKTLPASAVKTLLFLMAAALTACSSPGHLTPEELTKYIANEDNGLIKKAEINDTKIEVTYRPTDLWVHQELDSEAADTAKVSELRNKYSSYYYFIVSLSRNNKEALHQAGDFGTYSELVQTMSFRMAEYVTLTTARQDTIPVGDFMLNRTYGLSPATDLLFVFSKEKAKDKEWVQFNLNEFGLGIGNQRFRFRTKDIENAPKIYKTAKD